MNLGKEALLPLPLQSLILELVVLTKPFSKLLLTKNVIERERGKEGEMERERKREGKKGRWRDGERERERGREREGRERDKR